MNEVKLYNTTQYNVTDARGGAQCNVTDARGGAVGHFELKLFNLIIEIVIKQSQ